MTSNKFTNKKENVILIVITVLFVLGFLILSQPTITGYATLDNQSDNNSFDTQMISYDFASYNWTNKSDAVNLETECGANYPYGITTNGSDFWFTDWVDIVIYHLNSTYDNQTDAVNVLTECGASNLKGITTNGSDFWFIDCSNNVIYHIDANGNNASDSVNVGAECGSDTPFGITTNGSDFWFTDIMDDVIYHLNSTMDNQSDSVNVGAECGSTSPYGITTNGSDFWFIDSTDKTIYHLNSTYDNQSDAVNNIDLLCGAGSPYGLTTPSFNGTDFSGVGTPTEFYITDYWDDTLYHIENEAVYETVDHKAFVDIGALFETPPPPGDSLLAEHTPTNYDKIISDDTNTNSWTSVEDNGFVHLHYNFSIKDITDVSEIEKIKITWVGYDTLADGGNLKLFIWNHTSTSWINWYTDSTVRAATLNYTIMYNESSISDYVSSTKELHIGVSGGYYEIPVCFLKGTKILLTNNSYKNIEDIKVDDIVQSYDEENKKIINSKVIQTFYHKETKSYFIINNKLKLTPNHPTYINNEFKEAREAKIGDLLLDKNKNYIPIESIQVINETVPIYNLEVLPLTNSKLDCGPNNNYFAEDILVHNKCPSVFSSNKTDYNFESLINADQVGKENEKLFNYSLKHIREPKLRIEHDPNEINYVDYIRLMVQDIPLKRGLSNITNIIKPISCKAEFNCDLSLFEEIDYEYFIFDENQKEILLEFEEFPELKPNYNRTFRIISSGYQIITNPFTFEDYPIYVQEWVREYNSNKKFVTPQEHHTLYEDYVKIDVYFAPKIDLQFPANNTATYQRHFNFTYNVTDQEDYIDNCSFYLNVDSAGYNSNTTFYGGAWINQPDEINTNTECGADYPMGITTNGTDFWFIDFTDNVMYHIDANGNNDTDAVNVEIECGADDPSGITTNGSDFWFIDFNKDIIYHLNSTYDNQTDAVNINTECGATNPKGITTNGSDFWFIDGYDDVLYHLNSTYDNQSDSVNLATECGADNSFGITTNGSDFWFIDYNDDTIYHLNSTYDNQTDSIKVSALCGADDSRGITTPSFIMAENGGGTPTEFYITDRTDDTLYHIRKQVAETINNTFNISFDTHFHRVYWKVGCYNNNTLQRNSSVFYLHLKENQTINLQAPTNFTDTYARHINFTYNVSDPDSKMDNCTLWLNVDGADFDANITIDESITLDINQTFNKTFNLLHHDVYWKVGCTANDSRQINSTYNYYLLLNEYQTINLQYPANSTETYLRSINFTYNVSDPDNDIDNCTLYLNIDSAGYNANTTLYEGNYWTNKSDAFNVATECGASYPYGITTNGSDFWFTDWIDKVIYHIDANGNNDTDAVNVEIECGADSPEGITTNNSDFWFTDDIDNVIYHLNSTYDNQPDAVNVLTECGSDEPRGITTNGSDFWFADYTDGVIYHLNSTYDNQTDAVNVEIECGAGNPTGITTNGSDFWFLDYNDDVIYHLNSTYDNQSDSINVGTLCGSSPPTGITTPSFNGTDFSDVGTPTEFYITDSTDDVLYHIKQQVAETVDHTFNKSFTSAVQSIYWKVGCYADDSTPINSSAYYLNLIVPEDKGTASPAQPEPKEKEEEKEEKKETKEKEKASQEIQQNINQMNVGRGFSGVLKNLLTTIEIEDEPRIPDVEIQEANLLIDLETTNINVNFAGKEPTILITETTMEGIRPTKPSYLLRNLIITLLIVFILLFLLIRYFKKIKEFVFKSPGLIVDIFKKVRDIILLSSPTEYSYRIKETIQKSLGSVFKKVRSIKSIPKKQKKIELRRVESLTTELTDVYEINKLTSRFNKLSELIKLNINNIDTASKQYEELLTVYKLLILKLNKEDKSKLYTIIKQIYNELKNAIEINFYKKSLKK